MTPENLKKTFDFLLFLRVIKKEHRTMKLVGSDMKWVDMFEK